MPHNPWAAIEHIGLPSHLAPRCAWPGEPIKEDWLEVSASGCLAYRGRQGVLAVMVRVGTALNRRWYIQLPRGIC